MFFTIKKDKIETQYFLRDLILVPLGLTYCILGLSCPTFGLSVLLLAQFVLLSPGLFYFEPHLSYPTLGGKGNVTPDINISG